MKITKCVVMAMMALVSFTGFAQSSHEEAKALLNDASKKLKSYQNISLSFDYSFENKKVQPPVSQSEKGTIAIKGDDYRLKFMGVEQIRSGNMLYTILKEDMEVQVTEYDEEEDQGLTPSSIMNLYQKGYSYKIGKTYKENGITLHEVHMKPVASEEVKKIVIVIEQESKKIVSLTQWGTNGTVTTFTIVSFEPNKKLPANFFTFNKKDYPGYYIAD